MVGEGAAFVAAETAVQARDAAEAMDYAPLSARMDAALLDGAMWLGGNEGLVRESGDRKSTDKAFSRADRVVERRFRLNRVLGNAMETRDCTAIHGWRSDRCTPRAPIRRVARSVVAGGRFLRLLGQDECGADGPRSARRQGSRRGRLPVGSDERCRGGALFHGSGRSRHVGNAAADLDGDSGGAQREGGVPLRAPNGLRDSLQADAASRRQTSEVP